MEDATRHPGRHERAGQKGLIRLAKIRVKAFETLLPHQALAGRAYSSPRMSVRFASTNHPSRRLGWRAAGRGLIAPALARAANDNRPFKDSPRADAPVAPQRFDPLLVEALRHFAVHGLASAEAAVDAAAEAGQRGDAGEQEHWLAVTRLFDRRLAARASADLIPA